MDGTKLSPFVILKAKPGGTVETSQPSILLDGMHGCCQKNVWSDERTMAIWYERIWKAYVEDCRDKSTLLLDCVKTRAISSFGCILDSGWNIQQYASGT